MQVDVASRAPHARKHGSTFAETWQAHDGTVFVAVGHVFSGKDRVAVSDLLRTAGRAVVGSMTMMASALQSLDRIVQTHAHEQRDDELAAAVAVMAIPPGSGEVAFVGAGHLYVALLDGLGTQHPLHGEGAALGTGIEPGPASALQKQRLHRDDLLVAATVPIAPAWWTRGLRTAEALLHTAADPEASAAVIAP